MRRTLALVLLLPLPPTVAELAAAAAEGNATVSKAAETIADRMSVSQNQAGDLAAFLSALLFNSACTVGFLVAFSVFRLRYPKVYSNNWLTGSAKAELGKGVVAWIVASARVSTEEAAESSGLDAAMFLEFCNLSMRISAVLTLPLVLIMCPLHYYCGGGAAGDDRLSRIDMGNVVRGHPWLYYVHAAIVWGVCLVVQRSVYGAQSRFLALRFRWLKELPMPRANTVLVEHIPEGHRSDERLRDFFARSFSAEAVRDARVVRHTGALPKLLAARDLQRRQLREEELLQERGDAAQGKRGGQTGGCACSKVASGAEGEARLAELEQQIAEERARLQREAAAPGGSVNAPSGFVTFARRCDAEMAKGLRYAADRTTWLVSIAPDAQTIRWRDLTAARWQVTSGRLLGYAIIAAIYIFFMPICALITSIAKLVPAPGPLQPLWAGLVPTIGLQIMLAMMPTILLLLFDYCCFLKAEMWAQHQLQIWYFCFQLVFVVLVSAIGNSLASSLQHLAQEPFSLFQLLADNLPNATHFFMNYILLQWAAHAMTALRHSNLAKFLLWRALYSEEEARELAEPEDQAFQGCGSRYARLMVVMTICIVFSTLTPLIAPLSLAFFALCRLVYGYLLVFTETRKSDLGGAFWVTQLQHVQLAALLYCLLMVGILQGRAPNPYPAAIAAPALLFLLGSYLHFGNAFDWTQLPFEELHAIPEAREVVEAQEDAYVQPELLDDRLPSSNSDA